MSQPDDQYRFFAEEELKSCQDLHLQFVAAENEFAAVQFLWKRQIRRQAFYLLIVFVCLILYLVFNMNVSERGIIYYTTVSLFCAFDWGHYRKRSNAALHRMQILNEEHKKRYNNAIRIIGEIEEQGNNNER
jgi:hypothetical protein